MKTLLSLIACAMLILAGGVPAAYAQDEKTSAGSGNWSDPASWDPAGVPAATDNVEIESGHEIILDVTDAEANNLVVNGDLFFRDDASAALEINGDVTVGSGGRLRPLESSVGPGLGHEMTIRGSVTNTAGGVFNMRVGSNASNAAAIDITFAGTANSTISLGAFGTSNRVNTVRVEKTNGARLILGSDVSTTNNSTTLPAFLHLTSGILDADSHNFIVLSTSTASVQGGSGSSYVIGGLGRGYATSAVNRFFPVGDEEAYRPVTISATTGATSGQYLEVRVNHADANTGASTLVGGIERVSAVRYYRAAWRGGANSITFDWVEPTYGLDDGVEEGNTDLRVATSTDGRTTWTNQGPDDHTTDLSNPPTAIRSDAIAGFSFAPGEVFYVALASTSEENPLPVELIAFAAKADGRDVVLRWETATETNNAGFFVERRTGDSFSEIGFVEGQGSSSDLNRYSFLEPNLEPGTHTYRLRQMNFDGSFAFSSLVEVAVDVPGKFVLEPAYPNPFNPSAVIRFAISEAAAVTLVLHDALGREVKELYRGEAVSGEMISATIDGTGLSSGLYFVRLSGPSFSATQRVVLLK